MIITDILTPRVPGMRRRATWLLLLAAVALLGVPLYQTYYAGLSGSTESSSGAYGPRLRLTIASTTATIRGVLTITAPDGAVLEGPATLSVYPAGQPQVASNRVATVELATPAQLASGSTIELPFEISASGLPAGTYGINAEVAAQVDKGNVHAAVKTATAAEFAKR